MTKVTFHLIVEVLFYIILRSVGGRTMQQANDTKVRKPLTNRQKEIISILIEMEGQSITVKAISEQLKVSTRTILRDMPAIEGWMDENDFHFEHKPGRGLQIDESQENASLILELLDIDNRTPNYSRSERRQVILGKLFTSSEPIKAFVFTSDLKISQSTLFSDLDVLDLWLQDYDVHIVRRPGLGIYLKGEEFELRQAISNYIFEFCDINHIPMLVLGKENTKEFNQAKKNPLLIFFEPEIFECATDLVSSAESSLNVQYSDGGRIRLILRFMLAIYRMRNHHFIEASPLENKRIAAMLELSASILLIQKIETTFSIEVSKKEVDFFALYLSTTRATSSRSDFHDPTQSLDVWQVVMSMTRIVEQMTGYSFRENHRFIDDLVNHIQVVEKRVNLDLVVENHQTEEIRDKNPTLFHAVDTACEVLREWMYPKVLRLADVGYIALHFGAEVMRLEKQSHTVRVAVVCPYGVGSSKILAASIKEAFYNIEVVETLSAFSLQSSQLLDANIDFIITTTPLQIDYPNILVSSIMLQTSDRTLIQNQMDVVKQKHKERLKAPSDVSKLQIQDVQRLTQFGIEIQEILDHFAIYQVHSVEDKNELMELAGDVFASNIDNAKAITKAFKKREKQGDTFIEEMGVYLFHCVCDQMEHARFGYIQLKENMGKVEGAVVMIVPSNRVSYALEPIGRLSALLVEEKQYLNALKQNDLHQSKTFAEKTLVNFYKNEITK